jgi:hypothetical protein
VHLELRPQLTQRPLAAERLHRYPRLELRTVLFSRRRYRPLVVNDFAESVFIALSGISLV